MSFIVATNVIASRLPERQPTGRPHTRAKIKFDTVSLEMGRLFLVTKKYSKFFKVSKYCNDCNYFWVLSISLSVILKWFKSNLETMLNLTKSLLILWRLQSVIINPLKIAYHFDMYE